jgi:putative membrane protein insertion efficiency factor
MTAVTRPATAVAKAGDPAVRPGRVARALAAAVSLYRDAISPLRPPTCRYRPTCSEYALEAVLVHGALRGSWLALRRLLRCHPLHAGGHDPVPPRVEAGGYRVGSSSTEQPSGTARGLARSTAAGEE